MMWFGEKTFFDFNSITYNTMCCTTFLIDVTRIDKQTTRNTRNWKHLHIIWSDQSTNLIIANTKFYWWVLLFLTKIMKQLTFGLQFYFHLAENSLFYIVYCCCTYKCCWVLEEALFFPKDLHNTLIGCLL